jgi:hypothetical protein
VHAVSRSRLLMRRRAQYYQTSACTPNGPAARPRLHCLIIEAPQWLHGNTIFPLQHRDCGTIGSGHIGPYRSSSAEGESYLRHLPWPCNLGTRHIDCPRGMIEMQPTRQGHKRITSLDVRGELHRRPRSTSDNISNMSYPTVDRSSESSPA